MNDTSWVVEWAGWGWAALWGGMVLFELYTLWWNVHRGDGKQRANLTAYVRAYFEVGKRRLNRRAPKVIIVAALGWMILHFLGYL